jgi:hypothetical protein
MSSLTPCEFCGFTHKLECGAIILPSTQFNAIADYTESFIWELCYKMFIYVRD